LRHPALTIALNRAFTTATCRVDPASSGEVGLEKSDLFIRDFNRDIVDGRGNAVCRRLTDDD
jgi:hypothetical protein